jgi:2-polyprenyl-3-methyl-5-hydroxy-6-metoxy-1,4-benzoquinol methylase
VPTISEEYRELNRRLHADKPRYGANGHKALGTVMNVLRAIGGGEVLDYGAGKGTLGTALNANGVVVHEYDPAIKGKDAPPEPADVVYCGDVAEHVEPEYLDAFLDELRRVTKKVLILTVATRPAVKTLADGRNAHLIVEPVEWWLPKITARFDVRELFAPSGGEFTIIGAPK